MAPSPLSTDLQNLSGDSQNLNTCPNISMAQNEQPEVFSGSSSSVTNLNPKRRQIISEKFDLDLVRLRGDDDHPQVEGIQISQFVPSTEPDPDTHFLLSRQIAMCEDYICYGLNGGNIKVRKRENTKITCVCQDILRIFNLRLEVLGSGILRTSCGV